MNENLRNMEEWEGIYNMPLIAIPGDNRGTVVDTILEKIMAAKYQCSDSGSQINPK